MNGREIELKLEIDLSDYSRISELLKNKVKFVSEKHQVDVYYSPLGEHFYDSGDRCLRIRTEGNVSFLSFKRIHAVNTTQQYIEEYESKIDDVISIDKILLSLGFNKEIVVDKYRMEFLIVDEFLVSLDFVKNLGYFLEVENINDSKSIEERNKDLLDFVNKLEVSVSKRNTEGYSNMFYKKQKGRKDV